MKCSKCDRPATRQAFFLDRWRAFCRYHIGAYYDLPQRPAVSERQRLESEALQRQIEREQAPDWEDEQQAAWQLAENRLRAEAGQ